MHVQVFERYPGVVTRLDEESKTGAIYVTCAGVMGDDSVEIPNAIQPVFDWGWFYIPDIGEEVEIELIVQDSNQEDVIGQAIIDEPRFRWRGKRFRSEEGDQPRPVNELFTGTNFGKRRGFATPKGHVFLFDDKDGSELIQVYWTNKNGEVSCISLLPNGGIEILDKGGNLIATNGTDTIDVTAPNVNINSGDVADQQLIRGNELKDWITQTLKVWADSHVHPTAFGPSGPSVTPLNDAPGTVLSSTGKVH